MKTKMMKENRTIAAALLAVAWFVILSLFMFTADVYADTDPSIAAQPGSFIENGDKYTLSVELTRSGDHETGLIAESTAGGQKAERVFATKSGTGTVTFDFEEPHDAFRVIAVDKGTLAPICDDLVLVNSPDPDDIRKNDAKSVELSATGEINTATVIKAVTKDLIVAQSTVDALEALTTETISVEYEKSVTTVEGEGTQEEEANTTWETVTEDVTRYNAIAYDEDAQTEAATRLANMGTACENLKNAAALLHFMAGIDPDVNKEIRFFALKAGEVAKAAEDAAFEIEICFRVKKGCPEAGAESLVAALNKVKTAISNIRICGGAGVLNSGSFGIYPGGADLALVADETSSAVILCPDNGKVTHGAVSRTDGDPDAGSVKTDRVVIVKGDYTGVLETPSADAGTFYEAHVIGGAGTDGLLQSVSTIYDFPEFPWYLRAAVKTLTEYADVDLAIETVGTYDTWDAMLSAFLSATDNSNATIVALAGGSVQGLMDSFSEDVEESYNERMNYRSGWFDPYGYSYDPTTSPEAEKRLNKCWSVDHCTKDENGQYVGLVESYTYGVKTSERYYSSAGNGFNGLLYWKQWNVGEDNMRLDELRNLSASDSYNPEALDFVVPRCESEFLSSIDNNSPPNNGYTGSSQDDDGSGDELQGLQKVNVVLPRDRYKHQVIYHQKDENGSLCPKDSTRVWKDLYLELNYDAYEQLARDYEEEYEDDVQSFDLMYGNQAWEIKEQRVYDVNGLMEREFYYVGTMPDRDGGTAEFVRDNYYLISQNASGVNQAYLYIDQYIRWDQVKGGYFNPSISYDGTYAKQYYAPGKYTPDVWSKIPESLREEVAAHLHGETKRYVMHEYTLGTWEAEGDPPNGNTEPDAVHPFHPFDRFPVYVDNTDTAENEEKFLCDDDNRIGWRHTMYNIESHNVVISYEVIAALPLDP